MIASVETTLFRNTLIGLLRVPVIAALTFLLIAGPLLALPSRAYATHGGTHPPTEAGAPTNPLDCSSGLSACIASFFYVLFVQLTGLIAYFGGVVFDFVAAMALQGGTYADVLINKGWTIARDVANMAFVFLLIYLAFQLILNVEGVGVGKMLAKLIVVALLINFSFFFSRVVIDASNLLARQFYDHIRGREVSTLGAAAQGAADIQIAGAPLNVKYISENIMNGLNVQSVIATDSFKKFYQSNGFLGNVAILIGLFFIFGIINLILAFVFFTAAVQFLARIISLWMAVILSPIGFISFIIPGMKKMSEDWWHGLIRNAFFAPAFLFFFYIIVGFLDGGLLGSSVGQGLQSAQVQAGQGTGSVESFFRPLITIMIRLGIVVGLLMAALKVGDLFGQASARAVVGGAMKFAGGGLAGMSLGAAGLVGRNTIGRLALRASNSEGLMRGASEGRRPSLYTWRALNRVAGSSFDARAAAPSTAASLGLGAASGVGGRAEAVRRNEKERELLMAKITPPKEAPKEAPRNEMVANIKTDTANVSVANDLQLVQALRGLGEKLEGLNSTLGVQFKDLERSANDKQSSAKIGDVTERLTEQERRERESNKKRADDEIMADVLRSTGVEDLGREYKKVEEDMLHNEIMSATGLDSAIGATEAASTPQQLSATGSAAAQPKANLGADNKIAFEQQMNNLRQMAANPKDPDAGSGESARGDDPKPAPQDSSRAERADA